MTDWRTRNRLAMRRWRAKPGNAERSRQVSARWRATHVEQAWAGVRRAIQCLRASFTEWFHTFKNRPCMDCGKWWPPYVMDFDHVRGRKLFNVNSNAFRSGKTRAEMTREARKCELVCANCHRERTQQRAKRKASAAHRAP